MRDIIDYPKNKWTYKKVRKMKVNIADLHKKVMKEFGIHLREYNHLCFEGCYIYEIVEFVKAEIEKELEK